MTLWRSLRHFVDRLIPRYRGVNDTDSLLAHRYYQFLCSIIVGFFIIFSANSFYLGLARLGVAQLLVIGIILFSIFVYRKTKSIVWAVNIIMACTAPVTFYRALVLGGMDAPMIFGWPVISTLALMTLPLTWALVWTCVHMGFSLYFFFAELAGTVFPVLGPSSVVSNVRIAMIVAVQIILFFSVYLIRRLNRDLRQQLHAESEEVINVVRALSHDLSSPMMTLTHWIRTLKKKDLCPDLPKDEVLEDLQTCRNKIDEVRNREAETAGKSGMAKSESQDPEVLLSQRLIKFTVTLLFLAFSFFGTYYMYVGVYKVGLLQWSVAVVSLFGWWSYKKFNSVAVTGNIIMTLGSLSAFFRAQMMGGITSAAFFIWPIIPVFVGALLPIRYAAFWVSVYIGIALYYDIAARMGITFPSMISAEAMNNIRIILLCAVQAIVVVTIYYLKAQNQKFRDLIETQKKTRLDLLRVLSSEVGQPLLKIQEQIKKVQDQESAAQVKRSLQACLDVVQFAKGWVQAAETEVESTVDLREIVEEVSFLQESALKQKNIQLQIDLEAARGNPLVRGQRICFAYQILNNVVSNSIKFTPDGGRITLAIQDSKDHWSLMIEDTGIGIPQSLLTHIFDSDKPTTRPGTVGEKGTGFGMPIVKMFVEKYSGSIDIQSKAIDLHPQDHGTQIRIRLPKLEVVESLAA